MQEPMQLFVSIESNRKGGPEERMRGIKRNMCGLYTTDPDGNMQEKKCQQHEGV